MVEGVNITVPDAVVAHVPTIGEPTGVPPEFEFVVLLYHCVLILTPDAPPVPELQVAYVKVIADAVAPWQYVLVAGSIDVLEFGTYVRTANTCKHSNITADSVISFFIFVVNYGLYVDPFSSCN